MKASKGFLLLDMAVVFLIIGVVLLFVSISFGKCIKNLNTVRRMYQACYLAESALLEADVDVPEGWQVHKSERSVQDISLTEVQVLESSSGKILFNILWAQ